MADIVGYTYRAATEKQLRDLAGTIARQAQAIADGTITGPLRAHVRLLAANTEMLMAWTADEQSH